MSGRRSWSACRPNLRLALAAIALSIGLAFVPALAKRAAPGEAAEIARCIRIAARGHGWLEKTLWGLREQEAGWIGAEEIGSASCREREWQYGEISVVAVSLKNK